MVAALVAQQTERYQPRLPTGLRLNKGIREGGKMKELPHFVIEAGDPSYEDVEIAAKKLWGATPELVTGLRFLADSPLVVLEWTKMERWASSGSTSQLLIVCDGYAGGEQIRHFDTTIKRWVNGGACQATEDGVCELCELVIHIHAYCPELVKATGKEFVVSLSIKGKYDRKLLNDVQLMGMMLDMKNVPFSKGNFSLWREKQQTSYVRDGKSISRETYPVRLRTDAVLMQPALEAGHYEQLPPPDDFSDEPVSSTPPALSQPAPNPYTRQPAQAQLPASAPSHPATEVSWDDVFQEIKPSDFYFCSAWQTTSYLNKAASNWFCLPNESPLTMALGQLRKDVVTDWAAFESAVGKMWAVSPAEVAQALRLHLRTSGFTDVKDAPYEAVAWPKSTVLAIIAQFKFPSLEAAQAKTPDNFKPVLKYGWQSVTNGGETEVVPF